MRAVMVRRYGPPEVFELQQLPDPQPKPGEVLIRVKAIGVNFADLLQRMGIYPETPKPPFIPGLEVAGVVDKAAEAGAEENSESLRPGDAVVAQTNFNAYAEWVAVPAASVFRLPAGMGFTDGAAIPVNYLTAYEAIVTMGNMQPGHRILIHGAAGGVGTAAVQIARAKGLFVFGTAGPAKQEYLRKIGVQHAIDYEKADFAEVIGKYAPGGVEMVMDPIGGKSWRKSYECLAPTGRLVTYGFSAVAGPDGKMSRIRAAKTLMQTPKFNPLDLMKKGAAVIGVNLRQARLRGDRLRSAMNEIFRLYAAGKIKPIISKTFPLEQAAAAHQFVQ
ncbi:MAG: zinc-binding dehydrogenase, partial [Acidobacteriota bacterium]|nr:zinc-binding dehydrogenase [Acidobacteriota bacterium]